MNGDGRCASPPTGRDRDLSGTRCFLHDSALRYRTFLSNSAAQASKGTLLVMVGCDSDPASSRAWPVLQAFGHNIQHMGGVGTGAATKLAMNQLIASLTVGFSTSLGLLLKNGVDCNTGGTAPLHHCAHAPV